MKLILYQPDIPQNMGAMLRLAACFGAGLSIIEPCGFLLDDRRLDRVAMDYRQQVTLARHASWEDFQAERRQGERDRSRLILLTTKGETPCWDFRFRPDDMIMVGRESCGVPAEVAAACDARLVVPLHGAARSLNVGMAAAIAIGEATRQLRGTV